MKRTYLTIIILCLIAFKSAAQYKDYFKEGNEYMAKKNYALAEQTFREGIIIDSSLHILYTSCANAMIMQQKYNQADSALDEVLKKDVNLFGAYWFKGLNYIYWQKDSLSIIYFKQYISKIGVLQNKDGVKIADVYYYLGRAYENLLAKDGLSDNDVTELIGYYEKFCILAEGHPSIMRIKNFMDEVKAKKPSNYKGKWIYKTETKR